MHTAHIIISVILRVVEFCMSCVNLGILAKFFQLLDEVNAHEDPRWTYALAMAAISLSLSFLLVLPLKYSFYSFPIDLAMFVMWIVEFSLLVDMTGTSTCNSHWYDDHWIIYWGDVAVLGGSACSRLRVIVAFSFIIAFFWLLSGLLGLYTSVEYFNLGKTTTRAMHKISFLKKKRKDGAEHDLETQKLHKNGGLLPDHGMPPAPDSSTQAAPHKA